MRRPSPRRVTPAKFPRTRGRPITSRFRAPADPARLRDGRFPGRRLALAPRRPRRRHDAAREAPLEARSGRDRPARAPPARAARCSSRRRTARRRRARWSPRSCAAASGVAHNNSGANLVSGIASTLLRAGDAELGLFEVDEAALPEVARRVRPRGAPARQPLPRPARPLRRARDRRRALARGGRGTAGRDARRERRRPAGRRPRPRPRLGHRVRSRRPAARAARRCSTPPTRSTASAAARRTTTPRPTSATSATTAARTAATRGPPLDVVARDIELRGLDGASFTLHAPDGEEARVELALPGLYNVYNALGAGALALALGVPLAEIAAGLQPLLGRVRPLRADPGRRPPPADAADQEPGRRKRGRAHARRRPLRRASP